MTWREEFMNIRLNKVKNFGKRVLAFLLSVTIISQMIDFSVLSPNAAGNTQTDITTENNNAKPENNEAESENEISESIPIDEDVVLEDLDIAENYTLTGDIDVQNLNLRGGTLNLNNHTLTVHGNADFTGGVLYVNKGYLECLGNCSFSNTGCDLKMDNVNDYILVNGTFTWNRAYNNYITNGTIELKGDFFDNSNYSYYFVSHSDNKVILSGNTKQTLTFNSANTYFESLEINNTSDEGIYANLPIAAGKIIRNGHNITYPVAGKFGWTLERDQTIDGDLYLIGDELNLNGHTLTVTGNLVQGAGRVNVNNGTLNVEGDYRLQSYTISNEEKVYNYSVGQLVMTNESDRVNIGGDFVTGSVKGHDGKLTNGVMTVKGNFTQLNTGSEQNFAASNNHKVVFDGSEKQTISFASGRYDQSHFANVEFNNSSEDGIEITGTAVAVGEISNSESNITGYIDADTTATFRNNSVKGNIHFSRSYTLSDNLTINGDVKVESQFDLNTNKLEVSGNVDVYNSVVKINGGELVCKSNLSLYSTGRNYCYLEMTKEEDYVVVDKNFLTHNYNPYNNVMTAGVLEIKGNFIQECGDEWYINEENFRASGTHKTIFSGNKKQKISFASPKSYFNIVEVNNEGADGVVVTNNLAYSELIVTNGKIKFSDGRIFGEKLTEDKTLNGDVYLGAGTFDLNGHTLTVNGNLI